MTLFAHPMIRPTDVLLRPYQQDAIDRVRAEFVQRRRSTLLVMATGLGKTVVLGMVARRVAEKGGRTLILAHRGELIEQAVETLVRIGLDPCIEKASSYARSVCDPNVVVATVQTMQGDRLQSWPKDHFKLIITDEAHHSTADTYKRIYRHFNCLHLGVTATADRADDGALGDVFESVAYEYTLWDAMTAPAPGPYLSRLRFVQCDVGIDLRQIRTTAGDLNADELAEAIRPHIETLANAIRQEIGGRKTLVFTPDVGSAMAMSSALNAIGINTRWVAGDSADRKDIITGFKQGKFQALCNCALLLEGFDCADIEAIALCRPTKSRPLYTQIVGRGTRLAPGKENCLLIDFAWLTETHDLVKPAELFGSTGCDQETAAIVEEILKTQKCLDLHDVIEAASEEKKRRTELRVHAREREVRYRKVAYDPLSAMNTLGIALKKEASSNQGTITPEQRAKLERWKFENLDTCSRKRASEIIKVYGARLRKGLATHKQVSCLIRDGMDPAEARDKTIVEASALIDTIMDKRRRTG